MYHKWTLRHILSPTPTKPHHTSHSLPIHPPHLPPPLPPLQHQSVMAKVRIFLNILNHQVIFAVLKLANLIILMNLHENIRVEIRMPSHLHTHHSANGLWNHVWRRKVGYKKNPIHLDIGKKSKLLVQLRLEACTCSQFYTDTVWRPIHFLATPPRCLSLQLLVVPGFLQPVSGPW